MSLEHQIKLTRKYLKLKIVEDNVTFRGHKEEKEHLYDLFKRTIINGEAHSAFIIGPTGCGKTTLVDSVLNDISNDIDVENNAVVVRLNGLVHHDDKVALKAITAQMQLENAVGDQVFGSFAANLAFLLSCLKSGNDRRCRSMIFVLDEFDLFCHAGLGQTLLYNLFDITHNKTSPMCVIGITRNINIIELLEKRVKSRFSNRNISLYPNPEHGESKTLLQSYIDLFINILSLPFKSKKKNKRKKKNSLENDLEIKYRIPEEVLFRCHISSEEFENNLTEDFVCNWNDSINKLVKEELVINAIEKFCYYSPNEQVFRNILYQIISTLTPKKRTIDINDIILTIDKIIDPQDTIALLQSLSILELSLVIAMKHGMEIFDGQPLNFEMVYHRYSKFAITNSSSQTVPRPVILKAFEHLQTLNIITPIRKDTMYSTQITSSKVQKEYQLFTLCPLPHDIDNAVKSFKALPTEISHWYSNSVI